jgi:hypothetical protein
VWILMAVLGLRRGARSGELRRGSCTSISFVHGSQILRNLCPLSVLKPHFVPLFVPLLFPPILRYSSLTFFPISESRYSRFRSKREDSARKATRLERNDGSTVTASGLGLNSHYTHLGVHTARCVPRRIACVRTYRRMRERWCLAHIRRPPGQLEAPTSSCQL